MAIVTSKRHKLTASIFKHMCLTGTVNGATWWSNGHLMLQEHLLPVRTLTAIKKYNPQDFTSQIRNLLHTISRYSNYQQLRLINRKVPYQTKRCKHWSSPTHIDVFLTPNDQEVCLNSNYTLYNTLYRANHQYEIIDNIDDIQYVVMPVAVNKDDLASIMKRQPMSRFIGILREYNKVSEYSG